MKNIIKFLTASALSLSLFASCIQEVVPTDGLTEDQVAEGYLNEMVNGIPLAMIEPGFGGSGYHYDFSFPSLMIIREAMLEDFVSGGNSNYDWFSGWFYNMSQGPTGYNSIFWSCYYPWIKTCNDVLNLAKANIAAEKDVEASKAAMGLAYAYRASFYLDMARMYEYKANEYAPARGPIAGLTVPIVTETTTREQAADNPRATREDMYAFILEGLKSAETYLEGYSRMNISEPDLAVVYGLYARLYMELAEDDSENYKLAAQYARKAIDASGCTPLTQSEWESATTGFNNATSQNSWIWGLVQTSENVNNLASFTGWMSPEQTWGYASAPLQQVVYCASKSFYDMIPATDFRKHSFVDPAQDLYYNYAINYADVEAFYKGCPPYGSIKFRPGGGNTTEYKAGNATDIPMMRVEEMLLIEAEATGMYDLGRGKTLLVDFMKHRITDGSYDMGYIDGPEALQQEVFKQKRIEFWGEGILYFDYKRLEAGIERSYAGSNWPTAMKFNVEGVAPWWNIVIPQGEFLANTGLGDMTEMNNPDPSGTVPLAK